MRPLLMTLGDYRNLSLNGAKRLSYLTQLFPSSFNEKLCEQLLQHLKKLLEVAILAHKGNWTACHYVGHVLYDRSGYSTVTLTQLSAQAPSVRMLPVLWQGCVCSSRGTGLALHPTASLDLLMDLQPH
jgi:hypothetical protein